MATEKDVKFCVFKSIRAIVVLKLESAHSRVEATLQCLPFSTAPSYRLYLIQILDQQKFDPWSRSILIVDRDYSGIVAEQN